MEEWKKIINDTILKKRFLIPLFLILLSAFVIGFLVFPSLFYDLFIWKYFWGPIVSDSVGHSVFHNGVKAARKFTLVSEIIYGFLVIIAIYTIYKILERWNIKIDSKFCLSILPYVLYGAITRVLEDANFFSPPMVYWFVTPLIYIQIVVFFMIFLILGHYLHKHFTHPYLKVKTTLFSTGILILILPVFYMGKWLIGYQWSTTSGVRFDVLLISLTLTTFITFLTYLFAKKFNKKRFTKPYLNFLNLGTIWSHLLDGITSYISIYDPFNMNISLYIEKHPASDILMQIWPPLFPIIKFVLIIGVIYVLDVLYREELKGHINLVNLIKIGILILGFAPGLRDLLRVTMGI